MSEIVGEAWRKYMLQLQLHPLRTKAVTAGVLIGFSDAIAQKISGIKKLQFRRLLLLMLYGFVYSGPFGHFLHKMMDIIFKGKKGNKTIAKKSGLPLSWYCFTSGSLAEKIHGIQIPNTVLAPPMNFVEYLLITMILWMGLGAVVLLQVLLEQLTSSPWNNMLFMIYYGLVVEGRPWGLVKNKVRKDYPSIQLTAWKFWPIVGWVNYQYMPVQFRVVFHSFVASCWGIFLNLKARSVTIKKA